MAVEQRQSRHGPKEDELRELFARFGRAYYFADVLHRGLVNLCAVSRVPTQGPVTSLRVEEHLRDSLKLSLGLVVPLVRHRFTSVVAAKLDEAVARRNFLAHHFWYERVHLMSSVDGVEAMISELDALADLFQYLDVEVESVSHPLLASFGVTPEILADCLDEVKRGTPIESLPETRRPKKEEIVIGVYNAPSLTNTGKHVLVFETDDGLLWQLCDAGLGWSPYTAVDASWQKVGKFAELLPARINPRPPSTAPWVFDLAFGKGATLKIRLGAGSGDVSYTLERTVERSGS